MFRSLRALAALAGLVLFARACAAVDAPAQHDHLARRLKNLVDDCAFTMGEVQFDLCPVVNGNEGGWTVEFERRTPPTVTKTSYKIDLKAPLERGEGVPRFEQCPPGTWICQTISNRRPQYKEEESRVLQVIPVAGSMNLPNITSYHPGVNFTAQLATARDDPKTHILHIYLHGGWYVYGAQKADFQFLCDPSVDEPSTPAYTWSWNGTHTFQWRTKHACGSRRVTKPQPDPKDTPPAEDDDNGPPPDSEAHPRLARFRVGERVLVRWAYEDLEMDDDVLYADGEEDTMVNFVPEAEGGEGIPLKPSPRKGQWASYGAA
ncbi:hypothetical protein C8Q80DRAFT_1176892 [Daedaleopsis nitida]|nr:hypothetical protein C8Q80DRAFT_1176892 [Daedaleopsis nitida]